jgi:large subunit ribosomal protein L25
MASATKLTAAMRDRAGKGMARATRRQDRVPCVIYGAGKPPVMISLPMKDLERAVHSTSFVTHMLDIDVDGTSHHVLPRDVQLHPLTDRPIHVDFLRIDSTSVITVGVPFVFANVESSPGIKRGGVLNIVHHEIEVRCRPDQIPESITIEMGEAAIGTSIHLSDITLPEGVKVVTHEKDFTIATLAAPTVARSEEEEDQAAAAAASAASTAAAEPAAKA